MQKIEEPRSLNTRRILIYLLVTFVLTYGIEIFLIMPLAGSADLMQASLAQLFKAGVMFIPAMGAFITRLVTKEKFTKDNLMLSLHLKGNLKYYGLAWFGMVLFIAFGAVLYFMLFPKQFDPDMGYVRRLLEEQMKLAGRDASVSAEMVRQTVIAQVVMGIILSPFLNAVTCLGEEWGWRGFLLPKLLKRFRVVPTMLLGGVIWGLWHAPLILIGHNYGIGYWGFPYAGILAMCIFCIVVGTILSYVTIKTGSCIPAVMGHGTLNGFAAVGVCFVSLENPYNVFLGPMPVGLIGGAGLIVAAAVLLYILYREENKKVLTFTSSGDKLNEHAVNADT